MLCGDQRFYVHSQAVFFLESLMEQHKDDPQPRFVYVHCAGGVDRTGALIAAYLLHQVNAETSTRVILILHFFFLGVAAECCVGYKCNSQITKWSRHRGF